MEEKVYTSHLIAYKPEQKYNFVSLIQLKLQTLKKCLY